MEANINLALPATDAAPDDVKSCCAALYSSDWARLLLGDSFHPGGLPLTERLGQLLGLAPTVHLLDVAAGRGVSAIYLAERFGCRVTGIELSGSNVAAATAAAAAAGVADRVQFLLGDAERLPVPAASVDAVICECAFCTFPDKPAAAAEIARVLRPQGRVGLSDLTRSETVPAELTSVLAWVACIADAQPIERYRQYLTAAGLAVDTIEAHDPALQQMISDIRTRLIGAELMVALKKITLPNVDFEQAKALALAASDAVKVGQLGYALLIGQRSADVGRP